MFLKRFLLFFVCAMVVSLIVACEEEISQENSKPQLDESAEEMDEPVPDWDRSPEPSPKRTLDASLQIQYSGGIAEFIVSVTNIGDEIEILKFDAEQNVVIEAHGVDGDYWNSTGSMQEEAAPDVTINPGETWEYTIVWDDVNEETYRVLAEVILLDSKLKATNHFNGDK